MGCIFEVLLPVTTPGGIDGAEAALDEVARLDAVLSTYRADSEVSRLNAAGGLGPRAVSEDVFGITALSARLSEAVGGAFDPAAGALARVWGFEPRVQAKTPGHEGAIPGDSAMGRVPAREEIATVLELSGMKNVRLDSENRTVALGRAGLELNFGAIGKGYALDRAARILREDWRIPAGLVHGGASCVVALGSGPGSRDGWRVGLADPANEQERIGVVTLRDEGLATSGAGHRFIEAGGRRWGHIIDPRTGYPAEGPRSITVTAPTASEADALSTAFFILGAEGAAEYASGHEGVGAVIFPETDGEALAQVVGDIEVEFSDELCVEEIA